MTKRGICGICGLAVVNFAKEFKSTCIVNGHHFVDGRLKRVLCISCSYIEKQPFCYQNDYEIKEIDTRTTVGWFEVE